MCKRREIVEGCSHARPLFITLPITADARSSAIIVICLRLFSPLVNLSRMLSNTQMRTAIAKREHPFLRPSSAFSTSTVVIPPLRLPRMMAPANSEFRRIELRHRRRAGKT